MKRICVTVLSLLLLACPASADDRPHIVLVMADDHGYGDTGFTGHPFVKTPNLDAMAEGGVVFNRFYASAPVCSPTRASFMTGRHPFRTNVPNHGHYMRPQEKTIAEALKNAGYATGHFGKWHIGSVQPDSPTNPGGAGFDEWLSGLNFFDNDPYLSRNGRYEQIKGPGTVISMDATIDFLRRHKDGGKPMFTVTWFPSPHDPQQEIPQGVADAATLYSDQKTTKPGYFREITLLDQQMGRLRECLHELGIEDNTFFLYCSDNGGLVTESSGGRNKKGSIYEGGLRVPAILQWPARYEPKAINTPVYTADLYPTLDVDGNFLIGPDYAPAPEGQVTEGVPQGKVLQFIIDSRDTELLNPGIARKVFGTVDPANPKTLIVETHEIDYKRQITVYIPAQYVPGREAPFMVIHDGPKGRPKMTVPQILDNLIAQKRVPAMIAIMVANGGGDAQGHERGKEYDTMSGLFAQYIETEVLPLVEKNCAVKLTKDPDGRAAMGSSSGGSAALIMAWYRTDLYHRVLTTSGTFVNQQWPFDAKTPGGAWDFHDKLIPESPKKPLRIFLAVGDRDNFNPNVMRDGMHDWVEANNRMAKVLKAKGYHYQYLFCQNSGHGVRNAKAQFLPHAIEWVWKGYVPKQ